MEYDDINPIGSNEHAFTGDVLKMLKILDIKESLYDICEKLNYPKYVLDCMRTYEGTNKLLKDKDVYLKYQDSWIFLYSNLTLERRKSTKLGKIRTFTTTCRDLVCNDILETYLVDGINKNNKDFIIVSNDVRDSNGSFQIYKNATLKPDFKVIINDKEYLLELKCENYKGVGFIDGKYKYGNSYHKHGRYKDYKDDIYFLKVDIKHKKAAIFTYDELNHKSVDLKNIKVVDFNDKQDIYNKLKELILNKFN